MLGRFDQAFWSPRLSQPTNYSAAKNVALKATPPHNAAADMMRQNGAPLPTISLHLEVRSEATVSANDNLSSKSEIGIHPLPIKRIEQMLLFAAHLVDTMGAAAQPLLDRMEAEYERARTQHSAVARIRNLINAA